MKFHEQLAILVSAISRVHYSIETIALTISFEVYEDELKTAKALAKSNQLRAAGAIAGVLLEKHLEGVCKAHNVSVQRNPTISEFAAALKSAKILDLTTWKLVDYLGGLRNLCCHNKGRDTTKAEVQDLISGVERFSKTIV